MTAPAEQCWIITESELEQCRCGLSLRTEKIIRSRPAPQCKYWGVARVSGIGGDTNEWCCILPVTQPDSFPASSDLLLIAHDEWKRREERKHNHEEAGWISGWISGYLTSKKFVNERLAELHGQKDGGLK